MEYEKPKEQVEENQTEDRESIVLRGEDLKEFRELKEYLRNHGCKTNVAVFRKILNFYKANSPFLKQSERIHI